MIAVLERSGFGDRERTQGMDRAGYGHALVLPGACNNFSGETSVTGEQKLRQAFVAVNIDGFAHGGACELAVERGIHAYAAETILIKYAAGRITEDATRHFVTGRGVGLGKSNRVAHARPQDV